MPPSGYIDEKLALAHHADLIRAAQDERRAREAQGGGESSPLLPRLFKWIDIHADALRQQTESWAGRTKSLASQKYSYLDNPDPFRNCVTC
jgi:hypothetical protein